MSDHLKPAPPPAEPTAPLAQGESGKNTLPILPEPDLTYGEGAAPGYSGVMMKAYASDAVSLSTAHSREDQKSLKAAAQDLMLFGQELACPPGINPLSFARTRFALLRDELALTARANAELDDTKRKADIYTKLQEMCAERGWLSPLFALAKVSELTARTAKAEAANAELVEALTQADLCFEGAQIEGLADVMADSTDERLLDLLNRRILHARDFIVSALASHQQKEG